MIDYCMLYIVATPIGNLKDLSYRAVEILKNVDLILCEDPKKSQVLLNHYAITAKVISLHEHNELDSLDELMQILQQGKNLALISDAGTPLISDPGYRLVKKAHALNIKVSPIPGASAVVTAVSVSGLATNSFIFIGFLPSKLIAKQKILNDLSNQVNTMVFFEAPHRLIETLNLMSQIFGGDREATFCRELTKKFETIIKADLATIVDLVNKDQLNQTKGEIVLVVAGMSASNQLKTIDHSVHKNLELLLTELPLTKATKILAKMTGINRQELYNYWLSINK